MSDEKGQIMQERFKPSNKATILGVGTELTTGQIVNKNGSWLSEKLIPFGVETVSHLVVPDEKNLMMRALNYCAENSNYIFVTGGLGPTSDDFTRDIIATWAKTELIFDEKSWAHIKDRLITRGFTVKDIQKQQCYFPKGAKILHNDQGTAHGFQLNVKTQSGAKEVFVLPGPPREIEAIWLSSIVKWFFVETQDFDKKITKSWDTLGVGESDVASLVEAALQGQVDKQIFEIGYRVHLPYVEVKFSYMKSTESQAQALTQKINKALEQITVLRNFDDVTSIFTKLTHQTEFAFYDFVSEGFLHSRLSGQLKKYKNWMWKESNHGMDTDFFSDEENFLALIPQDKNFEKVTVMAEFKGKAFSLELEAPMKSELMLARRKQYFAEMALLEFVKRV